LGLSKKDWRNFKPSDLAFHPTTGDLYLLSSAGKRIIILTPNGQPLHSIALSPAIFAQPEGITFSPDGTLYISSEGDGGKGYILSFSR
jgi:uncharacterized protein YjiK